MINSINQASLVNKVTTNPVNQGVANTQYNQPQMVQKPNLNGINALSAYNQPTKVVNRKLEPAKPIELNTEEINQLKGEKVYSYMGKLNNITAQSEDGNTTIIYTMDYGTKDTTINKIEYFDNETGNLVKKQENYNDTDAGDKPHSKMCIIEEYDKNTKDMVKSTICTLEKVSVNEYEKTPSGGKKIYHANSSGTSYIFEETPNQPDKSTQFDKNGKIDKVIYIDREQDTVQTIQYKNGIPANIKTEKNEAIVPPNKNPQTDTDLIPAEPFILGYDPKTIQGERHNYSNGNIETIETNTKDGVVSHNFDVMGNLTSINFGETNKKHVLFTNDRTSIEESLNENMTKTTSYNKDGSIEVSAFNHKTKDEKVAVYNPDRQLTSYYEHNSDKETNLAMNYNKQGQLTSIM